MGRLVTYETRLYQESEQTMNMRKVTTRDALDALPDNTLIWYWIEWDSVRIHALMQKMSGEWYSATDPDDESIYKPVVPAYVLVPW